MACTGSCILINKFGCTYLHVLEGFLVLLSARDADPAAIRELEDAGKGAVELSGSDLQGDALLLLLLLQREERIDAVVHCGDLEGMCRGDEKEDEEEEEAQQYTWSIILQSMHLSGLSDLNSTYICLYV